MKDEVIDTDKVSDYNLDRLKQNMAQVSNSYLYTTEFKDRLSKTHLLIGKLQRLQISIHWAVGDFKDEAEHQQELAKLQENPINLDWGPEELIEEIKRDLEYVCFTPGGCLDYKIIFLLHRYGYPVHQQVSYYGNGDEFTLRHIRGDIYFFAPEVENVSY